MKAICRLIFVVAFATVGVSCDRKPTTADSGTDDGKLRPEVAVARQGASPTPLPNEVQPTATPTP